jgi:soluble lytic murein transglycosylase-like protein
VTTEVEQTDESGSTFRAKAEAAFAAEAALRALYASTFKHVKADDLKEVDPSQMASKAQEIEAARRAEREAIAREFLAERGVPEGDLEGVLSSLGQHPASQPDASVDEGVQARIAALGQLGGTAPSNNPIPQGVYGEDRIRAAVAASKAMT